jgi:DNA-binding transcriptional ArsR family regulator
VVHAADSHRRQGRVNPALLDRAFAALADPTRRAAVEVLRKGPQRAGDLARQLGSSPAGMSRHLRVLRESGLVSEGVFGDDARVRLLRLERAPFNALRNWVEDVETFWTNQLGSFKAHAEKTRGKRGRQ